MAGNDLRSMTPEIRDILINKDVVALDQDPLGRQGSKIRDDGEFEVWAKPLQGGDWAVALLNRSSAAREMGVAWMELGLGPSSSSRVRNLWTKQDLGAVKTAFAATVPSHEVVLIRVSPDK